MAEQSDPKSLEMRLTKLENAIGKLVESRKAADISAEEMKTYMKVRDAIGEPDFCGPNDCMRLCIPRTCFRCFRCIRCINRCINECICGPGGGIDLGGFSDIGIG